MKNPKFETVRFDHTGHLIELCRRRGQWGMMLSYTSACGADVYIDDLPKAVPFLDSPDVFSLCVEEHLYVFCDTSEDIHALYGQVVGDDGPTKLNPYSGPVRVYALTCGPDGTLGTENT